MKACLLPSAVNQQTVEAPPDARACARRRGATFAVWNFPSGVWIDHFPPSQPSELGWPLSTSLHPGALRRDPLLVGHVLEPLGPGARGGIVLDLVNLAVAIVVETIADGIIHRGSVEDRPVGLEDEGVPHGAGGRLRVVESLEVDYRGLLPVGVLAEDAHIATHERIIITVARDEDLARGVDRAAGAACAAIGARETPARAIAVMVAHDGIGRGTHVRGGQGREIVRGRLGQVGGRDHVDGEGQVVLLRGHVRRRLPHIRGRRGGHVRQQVRVAKAVRPTERPRAALVQARRRRCRHVGRGSGRHVDRRDHVGRGRGGHVHDGRRSEVRRGAEVDQRVRLDAGAIEPIDAAVAARPAGRAGGAEVGHGRGAQVRLRVRLDADAIIAADPVVAAPPAGGTAREAGVGVHATQVGLLHRGRVALAGLLVADGADAAPVVFGAGLVRRVDVPGREAQPRDALEAVQALRAIVAGRELRRAAGRDERGDERDATHGGLQGVVERVELRVAVRGLGRVFHGKSFSPGNPG